MPVLRRRDEEVREDEGRIPEAALPRLRGRLHEEDRQRGEAAVVVPLAADVRREAVRHAGRRARVQAQVRRVLGGLAAPARDRRGPPRGVRGRDPHRA